MALLLSQRPWARTLRALLVRAGLAPPLTEAHPLVLLELAVNIARRFNAAVVAGTSLCRVCGAAAGRVATSAQRRAGAGGAAARQLGPRVLIYTDIYTVY